MELHYWKINKYYTYRKKRNKNNFKEKQNNTNVQRILEIRMLTNFHFLWKKNPKLHYSLNNFNILVAFLSGFCFHSSSVK